MKTNPTLTLLVVVLSLSLWGCGQTTHQFITDRQAAAPVKFQVNLDRPFVSTVSSLGGGQAAMLLLVGPFTNNAVLLVAKEATAGGEKIAFRQRLKWGVNSFEALLNKNATYQLLAVVQGTRTGAKEIGSIKTSGDPQQFTINLLENEVSIK
jgi:hypothetical protein